VSAPEAVAAAKKGKLVAAAWARSRAFSSFGVLASFDRDTL
jgi:hypothetical protein